MNEYREVIVLKKIIIIGAGGFGRELLQWIKDINNIQSTWEIAGFLDDNKNALDNVACDYQVIGTITDWIPKEDEEFVLALGSPKLKRKIVSCMKQKGAKFATVIHPTAIISEFAEHGEGLVMFPYSKLSCNSVVGDFVTLLSSGIGHDVQIGDFTTISGMCSILRNVIIGEDVFIAAGVSVAQDVTIGNQCYLGLGSVVLKNIPEMTKTFGNPARVVPI